jgi:hypothetical protein
MFLMVVVVSHQVFFVCSVLDFLSKFESKGDAVRRMGCVASHSAFLSCIENLLQRQQPAKIVTHSGRKPQAKMEGRFPGGLALSAEESPKTDCFYVRLSGVDEGWCANGRLIEALRGRNYTDDETRRFSYCELCRTSQGVCLLYQTQNKSRWLAQAQSSLRTFFEKTGVDPALSGGLRFLDFAGVLLIGLLPALQRGSGRADDPVVGAAAASSPRRSLLDQLPERYRLPEKPSWEDYRKAIVDAGGVPKASHKAWAIATGVCEVDSLEEQTKRLCLRDDRSGEDEEEPKGFAPDRLIRACVPAQGPPPSAAALAKTQRKQDEFCLELAISEGHHPSLRDALREEVAGLAAAEALAHVLRRRKKLEEQAEQNEADEFGCAPPPETLLHFAHHTFDGVLHMAKAKTSKQQGGAEWKAILKAALTQPGALSTSGFQGALKVAHSMMNQGLLPVVSRELNPTSKRSLMIHRCREVVDDITKDFVGAHPDSPDRPLTTAEFEREVQRFRRTATSGDKWPCSVCLKPISPSWFFEGSTRTWHPVGFKGGKSAPHFVASKLGRTQFVFCSAECDEALHASPWCPTCGWITKEHIKWSDETFVDPAHSARAPVRAALQAIERYRLAHVKPEGLRGTQDNEWEEKAARDWTQLLRGEEAAALRRHVNEPAPMRRDALCKRCGCFLNPLLVTDEKPGAHAAHYHGT